MKLFIGLSFWQMRMSSINRACHRCSKRQMNSSPFMSQSQNVPVVTDFCILHSNFCLNYNPTSEVLG